MKLANITFEVLIVIRIIGDNKLKATSYFYASYLLSLSSRYYARY